MVANTAEPGYTVQGTRYPVIFPHETITLDTPATGLGRFLPFFGPDRPTVNPETPELLDKRVLKFKKSGEYYLVLGADRHLRVLVLDPDSSLTNNVLSLFDFITANNVPTNGDQPQWNALRPTGFLPHWFTKRNPSQLLCGPTGALLRLLVEERFKLPTRMAALPGVTRNKCTIRRAAHNVAEIYLPEFNKFVVFDSNANFVPRWLSALEVSDALTQAIRTTGDISPATFALAGLDLREGITGIRRVVHWQVLKGSPDPVPFSPAMASQLSVTETRKVGLLQVYHGGVGYFGKPPYGTGFLPAPFVYASLHTDPELENAALDWIRSYGFSPLKVTAAEMNELLGTGFEAQIADAAWVKARPPSAGGLSK